MSLTDHGTPRWRFCVFAPAVFGIYAAAASAGFDPPNRMFTANSGSAQSPTNDPGQLAIMPDVGAGGGSSLQPGRIHTSNLSGFNIVIVPGAALAANVPALQAFERAANQWEQYIRDPIVVTVNADLAPLAPNVLGSTNSFVLAGGYDEIRDAMVADAGDESDDVVATLLPTAAGFSGFLPAGFGFDGSLQLTKANAKALEFTGLDELFGVSDAQITFSSNFSFDFDNSNGVTLGQHDFETVAAHEIGHALGFISEVDFVDFVKGSNATSQNVEPTTLDLFRFDDAAANDPETYAEFATYPRSLVPGNIEHFDQISNLYFGDEEVLLATGVTQGDGRQASHWKDFFFTLGLLDPTLASGQISPIQANDLRAFDLIGYDIVPEPSGAVLLLLGSVMAAALRRHRGLQILRR
jgi:hypothetical protein